MFSEPHDFVSDTGGCSSHWVEIPFITSIIRHSGPLLERHVRFDKLYNAHLLICATNYSSGDLETFYSSRLIEEFVSDDRKLPAERQRLLDYDRLESQEQLVQTLLASTAVPLYLPPVKMRGSLYVDGGIGNNTPLRQAAYICRFLSRRADVQLEPTFCVINDRVRFTIEPGESSDIFGVVRRTLDIFHNALLTTSESSWDRISKEARVKQEKEQLLESVIGQLGGSPEDKTSLRTRIGEILHPESTFTPRLDLPLMVVRPKTPLVVKDLLCFEPSVSKTLKEHGYLDCLDLLKQQNFITPGDCQRWSGQIE